MINSNQPFLSICIPTYNRADVLPECLNSILIQLQDTELKDKVEIVISDNNSQDNTTGLIKKYQAKYKNIRYYKNKTNIGPAANAVKVASLALGKYIWFFSDDDLQNKDAIQTVLRTINEHNPDVIFCNVALYSKDAKKLLEDNVMLVDKDIILKSKKELFSFLEKKFFLALEWFTSYISCIIISRSVFDGNHEEIKKMDGKKYLYPHTAYLYYNANDYQVYVMAKTLIKYRTENASFDSFDARKDSQVLPFVYKMLLRNDLYIYKVNRKNISFKFTVLLLLKYISRYARLLFMKLIRIDISKILIRLYYGKYPLDLKYNR